MAGPPPRLRQPGSPARGFALLVILVILVTGMLYLFVQQFDQASLRQRSDRGTSEALAQAREGLLAYAVTYRDSHAGEMFGYLPCPDTDGDGIAELSCDIQDTSAVGLLPYRTLRLPDLRDAQGNCLWYAVSGRYKYNPKTSRMNWDSQGQFAIKIENDSGATLVAPDDAQGGAAAVVFAPAATMSGQSRTAAATPCGVIPTAAANYHRQFLEGNYVFPGSVGSPTTVYQAAADSTTKNDRLLWLTPKEIFDRVKKRADMASQFNELLEQLRMELEVLVSAGGSAALPAGATGYPAATPTVYAGALPIALSVHPNYQTLLANWSDHFHYARCAAPGAYCLDLAGHNGQAAVVFAGDASDHSPRPSGQRQVSHYLENEGDNPPTGALPLMTGTDNRFYGRGSFAYKAAATVVSSKDVGVRVGLAPGEPLISFADNIATFALTAGSDVVSSDTAAKTITLGQQDAAGTLYGCAWYGRPVPLGAGLRAYFKFRISLRGEGFTFALADAHPNRNASTSICGAVGARLGYAGDPGSSQIEAIRQPKMAVEFDTRYSSGRGDSPITSPAGSLGAHHVALLYWGNVATPENQSDDNTHGAGSAGSPTAPKNPNSVPGYANFPMATNTDIHVRIDIARSYAAATDSGSYVAKAYLASSFPGACALADFTDLSADLAALAPACPATIADTVTLADPGDGGGEALKHVYLGFTNAQTLTRDQVITIHDFIYKNR